MKFQLEQMFRLVKKQLVAFDYRRSHIRPECRTFLSFSEIEIKSVDNKFSIYLTFPIEGTDIKALVWTTTPYSLFCNQAIGYNPELKYVLIEVKGQKLLCC
jgi:isoleucyl-tRNA synthetase